MSAARRPAPIRLYGAGVGLAAVAIWIGVLQATAWEAIAPTRLPWWGFAFVFYLAEAHVVHLQFRREAHAISLGAAGVVLGLYALSPAGLLGATLAGTATALVLARRRDPAGISLDLARAALTTAVALVVFRAVAGLGDPFGPAGWAGATLGVVAASLAGSVLLAAGIAIARRLAGRAPAAGPRHDLAALGRRRVEPRPDRDHARPGGRQPRSSCSSFRRRSRWRPSARQSRRRAGRSTSSSSTSR